MVSPRVRDELSGEYPVRGGLSSEYPVREGLSGEKPLDFPGIQSLFTAPAKTGSPVPPSMTASAERRVTKIHRSMQIHVRIAP